MLQLSFFNIGATCEFFGSMIYLSDGSHLIRTTDDISAAMNFVGATQPEQGIWQIPVGIRFAIYPK